MHNRAAGMGANSDPATRTSPSWAGVISKAMSLPRLSTTAWIFVVALHSCFLERPVHSFDLAVRPRMVRLCESVLDAALPASAIERMTAPHCGGLRTILCQVSELNAVAHWERAQWEPRAAARSPVSAALPSEAIAGRSQVSKVSVSALHSGGISP
jgi:hypothetical protein